MTAKLQREIVSKLAKCDSDQALKVAREISDPWVRAQALSHVARFMVDDPSAIAQEAANAAQQCDESYKRSAVRAWEIAALAERGKNGSARQALQAATTEASLTTPACSRSEALILLLHAAARIGLTETLFVAEALRNVLSEDTHWRCIRAVKTAVAIITRLDHDAAKHFSEAIGDESTKAKCLAAIRDGGMAPRPFFW